MLFQLDFSLVSFYGNIMFDIKFIRNNPALFDSSLSKRGEKPFSKEILKLDRERRTLIEEIEKIKAERNNLSNQFGASKTQNKEINIDEIRQKISDNKIRISGLEEKLKSTEQFLYSILVKLPNILNDDVPVGKDELDNKEISKSGIIKEFDFQPLEHFEVNGAKHGLNFKDAATVSGSRFVFLSGAMALLHRALSQFMLNTHITKNSLEEFWSPILVKESSMTGTGQLPKFEDDSYKTTEGLWLIPTAEVPLTNIGRNKIYDASELPKRMTSSTQCFRSEAGSAGKDTTGMIRQHQFEKVEMVTYCVFEDGFKELERMTNCAENILKSLRIPFRKILLCSGDTGFGAKKTYDLEVWLPGQKAYREISSCSLCGDFQSRRINIRYKKDRESKPEFVSTLNGSGLAVGRCLVAVIENYQTVNGAITIPEVLRPYTMGYSEIDEKGVLK